MRFGAKIDLVTVAVVSKEQHFAAVGDQDQRIVGKGHWTFPPTQTACLGEREHAARGCCGSSHDQAYRALPGTLLFLPNRRERKEGGSRPRVRMNPYSVGGSAGFSSSLSPTTASSTGAIS